MPLAPEVVDTDATVANGDDEPSGHVAWVIGFAWQRQGFASEAACALVGWLRARGATEELANGEQVWRARR